MHPGPAAHGGHSTNGTGAEQDRHGGSTKAPCPRQGLALAPSSPVRVSGTCRGLLPWGRGLEEPPGMTDLGVGRDVWRVCIHVATRFGDKQELSSGLCMRTVTDICPSSTSSSNPTCPTRLKGGKFGQGPPELGGTCLAPTGPGVQTETQGCVWRWHSTHHEWPGTNPAPTEERRDKGKQ